MITRLESSIYKLTERLDHLELAFKEQTLNTKYKPEDFEDVYLTPREKEVFFFLHSKNGSVLNYKDIARQLGLLEEDIQTYINSMIKKGIPVQKKYFENSMFIIIDPEFNELQTKFNVIAYR